MADTQLRDVIDNLRSRLQTELEAELATLADSHEQALEDARRDAAAQAEQQWAGRLEAVRTDWSARLQNEVAAVRSEAERQMVADSMRARVDAEQAALESAASLRREMEQALATERARAEEGLSAERARAEEDLNAERARAEEGLNAERARAEEGLSAERARAEEELNAERQRAGVALADAQAALDTERQRTTDAIEDARKVTPSLDTTRLVAALRAVDDATSLTGVLGAAVAAAAAEAPRATILIVNGAQLNEWVAPGGLSLGAGVMRGDGREAGFLAQVLAMGEPLSSGDGRMPPAFSALPQDRRAVGVPLMLGGQPVAILYADEGRTGEGQAGWIDAIQILGRHAAAALACITARKTVEALNPSSPQAFAELGVRPVASDDEQGARRYARLLVSEIKLYNEAAVRTGREMRDLSQRLRPEIERARRLYEERVSPAVAARDMYFHQELVQALAGGDPSLLG